MTMSLWKTLLRSRSELIGLIGLLPKYRYTSAQQENATTVGQYGFKDITTDQAPFRSCHDVMKGDTPWFTEFVEAFPIFGVTSPWLAGGSVRRAMIRENGLMNFDFDIFFESDLQYQAYLAWFLEQGALIQYETQWQTTLTVPDTNWRIQLGKRFSSSLHQLLSSFDFTICKFAFANATRKKWVDGLWYDEVNLEHNTFFWTEDAWEDTVNKRLKAQPHVLSNPIGSFIRIQKYYDQGFIFTKEEAALFMHYYLQHITKGDVPKYYEDFITPDDWANGLS